MSTKKQKREKKEQQELQRQNEKQTYRTLIMTSFIFLLSFVFFFWGASLLPVTDPVESNYALTAKEMVLSGDFMSPQIYHTYWFDKPIMIYWLTALSYIIFGFTDWAARIPSALCGALTITLLTHYILYILKNNIIAIWSGIILATSLECWLLSHAIITDAALMLFTVITLFSAYIGITEHRKMHMTIAYIAAGLACLTKGPVGLVLPGLILLVWCAWQKNKIFFFRLFPWQGILAFLITVLPWYVGMYHIHGMDFINEFLGLHNVLRATVSEHPNDNHFYYYLIVFPISLLPWVGLFFYSLKKYGKSTDPFHRFLLTWCGVVIVFYTLMATKYITYTYIAVAPAAVLSALSVPDVTEGNRNAGLAVVIPFFLFMGVLIGLSLYIPSDSWWALYLIILYAVWALVFRWNRTQEKRMTTVFTVTVSAILIVILSGFPSYMHSRSFKTTAEIFHSLPGHHYFYRTYPTSYPYYTGDYGPRIISDASPSKTNETRDSRWDNKSPIPTITDSQFEEKVSHHPTYVFLKKNNKENFNKETYSHRFVMEKETKDGYIYKEKTVTP